MILVVDDDESIRQIIQTCAQEAGYEVQLAGSGKQAIKAATKKPPHVLMADLFMPEMDGLELIRYFLWRFRATRIIAISGSAEYLNVARLLGAHSTLLKPLEQAELLEAIAEQIGRKHQP